MKKSQIDQMRSFNRFYTQVIGLLDRHILSSEYSLPEARILYELYHTADLTSSDLINTLDIDKGYLSRILKKFEKQNLLQKKVSDQDRRVINLRLTDHGRAEFELLNNASSQQIKQIFENHSDSEIKDLVNKMKDIKNLITKRYGKNKH